MAAIADQVFKQIEDLWLNGHKGLPAAELTPPRVEDVFIEKKDQLPAPGKRGFALSRPPYLPSSHRDMSAPQNQSRVKEISRPAQSVVAAPLALSWEGRLSERSPSDV